MCRGAEHAQIAAIVRHWACRGSWRVWVLGCERDLCGVGNNLRDHYGVRMVSHLKGIKTFNSMAQGLPLGFEIAKWLLGRPSILSVSPSLTHLFWKSSDALETPDLEYVMTPASFREGTVGLLDNVPGMTVGVWQMRPESHGYVRPVSRNPFDPPEINPNYLSDPRDQQVLLRSIRLARKLMTTAPLQPYLTGKTNPDQSLESDDELAGLGKARRHHGLPHDRNRPDGAGW